MSKYTKLIDVSYFDHVTRFPCSDWLKCCITLQSDTALVITLSVSVLHKTFNYSSRISLRYNKMWSQAWLLV